MYKAGEGGRNKSFQFAVVPDTDIWRLSCQPLCPQGCAIQCEFPAKFIVFGPSEVHALTRLSCSRLPGKRSGHCFCYWLERIACATRVALHTIGVANIVATKIMMNTTYPSKSLQISFQSFGRDVRFLRAQTCPHCRHINEEPPWCAPVLVQAKCMRCLVAMQTGCEATVLFEYILIF
jgi:hypothetical protein